MKNLKDKHYFCEEYRFSNIANLGGSRGYCKRSLGGFTLVETTIVVLIIGLFLLILVSVASSRIEVYRIKTTQDRLEKITEALEAYINDKQHVPCPSDVGLAFEDANFGIALFNNDGDSCDGTEFNSSVAVGDGVPVIDLGLPAIFANDGWGRRFTYYMTKDLADFTNYSGSSVGAISIKNLSGREITDEAVFVIISHGSNGGWAYGGKGGSSRISGVPGGNEQENADNDNEIRLAPHTSDFDDMLSYKLKYQIEIR